jgi:hypothetical protein
VDDLAYQTKYIVTDEITDHKLIIGITDVKVYFTLRSFSGPDEMQMNHAFGVHRSFEVHILSRGYGAMSY